MGAEVGGVLLELLLNALLGACVMGKMGGR